MNLLKEMKRNGINVRSGGAKIEYKVFEDNSGAFEIAREKKYRPRTRHMNIRLHHFRAYVDDSKEVTIHGIDSEDQPADLLTKPLNERNVTRHRLTTMGW